MKVSREEAAANRDRIVDVASRLFREKGFQGIGVADLMKAAGLTHGGFYGHFQSKDQLAEEASGRAAARSSRHWVDIAEKAGDDAFAAIVRNYLSEERLAGPGCIFAALGSDAARQSKSIRRVFSEGLEELLSVLGEAISGRKSERRRRSIAAFSEMVGALVLARSVADPALAKEILQAVSADLVGRRER
jgi:TetR/AcrR family transcriptional regulator, transcriptional repressor for nem operon